jgi:hypothetical protein
MDVFGAPPNHDYTMSAKRILLDQDFFEQLLALEKRNSAESWMAGTMEEYISKFLSHARAGFVLNLTARCASLFSSMLHLQHNYVAITTWRAS